MYALGAPEVLLLRDLGHQQHVGGGDVVTLGRSGVRVTSGDADHVASLDEATLLHDVNRGGHGLVNIAAGSAVQHGDAPVEAALAHGLLVGGHGEDRQLRAEVGDEAGGAAGVGGGDDALGAHAVGGGDGGKADGAVDVTDAAALVVVVALLEVLLGLLADGGHHLHGLDRVLAGGGLAGEHHAVGSRRRASRSRCRP